jgi:hypothetical protein
MPTVDVLKPLLEEHDYREAGKILDVSHMTVKAWATELGLLDIRRQKRIAAVVSMAEHSLGKGRG